MQLPQVRKPNKTLKQVVKEEFGEVVPLTKDIPSEDLKVITDEEFVDMFGGFWEKFIFQTVLVNFERLKYWALVSTMDRWFRA